MTASLPRSTTGALDELGGDDMPACPWCGRDPGEATLTLNQLAEAHGRDRLLGFIERADDGTAPVGAVEADCPHCVRPFVVALQRRHGWRYVRLLPVLTPTDAKYRKGRG